MITLKVSNINTDLSNSIYDKFIENDDKNIIQAVKFLIRFYSKYQELKMMSYYYKWRRCLYQSTIIKLSKKGVFKIHNLKSQKE